MDKDLIEYIINYCKDWMLPEEQNALRRKSLTKKGKNIAERAMKNNFGKNDLFGFHDEKTNQLIEKSFLNLEEVIAKHVLDRHSNEVLNNCPKCNKLARTPYAKQCRYCNYDWH